MSTYVHVFSFSLSEGWIDNKNFFRGGGFAYDKKISFLYITFTFLRKFSFANRKRDIFSKDIFCHIKL